MPRTKDSMVWTPEVDRDVLLAYLDARKPTEVEINSILASLQAQGHNVTRRALTYVVAPAFTVLLPEVHPTTP